LSFIRVCESALVVCLGPRQCIAQLNSIKKHAHGTYVFRLLTRMRTPDPKDNSTRFGRRLCSASILEWISNLKFPISPFPLSVFYESVFLQNLVAKGMFAVFFCKHSRVMRLFRAVPIIHRASWKFRPFLNFNSTCAFVNPMLHRNAPTRPRSNICRFS